MISYGYTLPYYTNTSPGMLKTKKHLTLYILKWKNLLCNCAHTPHITLSSILLSVVVRCNNRMTSSHHLGMYQFQPLLPVLFLHRCCPWPHDVSGPVGSRRDHRLPGCREICASAEGRAQSRTFTRPLAWYESAEILPDRTFSLS